jgi:DNA-binding transcriptional regulator YdaS (Cro superfamily)
MRKANDNALTINVPGVSLSPVGLTLPPSLTAKDREKVASQIAVFGSAYRWAVADFLNYADKYGEQTKFADVLGLSPDTVRRWCYVASRVETVRRRTVLSFTHHETVAALLPSDQENWLQYAEESRLAAAVLRVEIARAQEEEAALASRTGRVIESADDTDPAPEPEEGYSPPVGVRSSAPSPVSRTISSLVSDAATVKASSPQRIAPEDDTPPLFRQPATPREEKPRVSLTWSLPIYRSSYVFENGRFPLRTEYEIHERLTDEATAYDIFSGGHTLGMRATLNGAKQFVEEHVAESMAKIGGVK